MSADVRQQLAEALEDQFAYAVSHATIEIDWNEEADALLPLVERITVARAAQELREAADDLIDDDESDPAYLTSAEMLRARARALDGGQP